MKQVPIVMALCVCALPSAVPPAHAQEEADAALRKAFRAKLDEVYDYLPTEVSAETRTAKSAAMDTVWELVKSDLATYRPLLREALLEPDADAWFLYDGAALLGQVAEGAEDRQLAADCVGRCAIDQVAESAYFHFVHALGKSGADTFAAVRQMLASRDFQVFVPQHALTLDRETCARLCLLPLDEMKWVGKLIAALPQLDVDDHGAWDAALGCLARAVTPEADAALAAVAKDETAGEPLRKRVRSLLRRMELIEPPLGEPMTSREQFEDFLRRAETDGILPYKGDDRAVEREALHHVRAADEPLLRRVRRKIACRVSDEALLEIETVTKWLRRAVAERK